MHLCMRARANSNTAPEQTLVFAQVTALFSKLSSQ